MSRAARVARVVLAALGERRDGWLNPVSGLGDPNYDRGANAYFQAQVAMLPEQTGPLFHGDWLAGRVASIYPQESLKRSPTISGRASEVLERLRFFDRVQLAAALGRATGGAVVVLGTDDNQPRDKPIGTVAALRWLEVHDRRSITTSALDRSPRSQFAGEADVFRISPPNGDPPYDVHRSRCLVFGGIPTAEWERAYNAGWDWSIYDRIYNTIRGLNEGFNALGNMLGDASQPIYKLKGLFAALSLPEGKATMARRATMLELFRGLSRAILLDADAGESFERSAIQFNGAPEAVDQLKVLVAAAAEVPVTKLFGVSPAGLNATGESDSRLWYDDVEAYRTREIVAHVARVVRLLDPAATIEWPRLWTPTEVEQAAIELSRAQRDAIYLDRDVATADEVARARLVEKPGPVLADLKARAALAAAAAVEPPPALPVASVAPVAPAPAPAAQPDPLATVDEARRARGLEPVNDSRLVADVQTRTVRIRAVRAVGET